MGIEFPKELQDRINKGELVPVVLVFHRPVADKLVIFSLGALSMAEAEAILRAYTFPGTTPADDKNFSDSLLADG